MSKLFVLHPGWSFDDEMQSEEPHIDGYFEHSHLLSDLPEDCDVVLPRFRSLPFGRELEQETQAYGAKLINSFHEHRWCADLGAWYPVLKDLTFESWSRVEDIPFGEDGPFVVKGETNSRRQLWKTHCFAESRRDLGYVIGNLLQDSLIQYQQLWIRKFVPLHSYGTDVVGMPINEEYRIFFLDGKELARGFYWISHEYMLFEAGKTADPASIPQEFVEEIGNRILPYATFVAVDVARTAEGDWKVVEVNDGCMAGCCGVNPRRLYKALHERFS